MLLDTVCICALASMGVCWVCMILRVYFSGLLCEGLCVVDASQVVYHFCCQVLYSAGKTHMHRNELYKRYLLLLSLGNVSKRPAHNLLALKSRSQLQRSLYFCHVHAVSLHNQLTLCQLFDSILSNLNNQS